MDDFECLTYWRAQLGDDVARWCRQGCYGRVVMRKSERLSVLVQSSLRTWNTYVIFWLTWGCSFRYSYGYDVLTESMYTKRKVMGPDEFKEAFMIWQFPFIYFIYFLKLRRGAGACGRLCSWISTWHYVGCPWMNEFCGEGSGCQYPIHLDEWGFQCIAIRSSRRPERSSYNTTLPHLLTCHMFFFFIILSNPSCRRKTLGFYSNQIYAV